ncbi:MAG: hypothetical protein QJR00_07120, partial [Bacillota bacterium]|nr:hypothetical protein [Bacillota bacterium]
MFQKRFAFALPVLALTLLLAACGGNPQPASDPAAGGDVDAYDPEAVITLVTNADPTFNPW